MRQQQEQVIRVIAGVLTIGAIAAVSVMDGCGSSGTGFYSTRQPALNEANPALATQNAALAQRPQTLSDDELQSIRAGFNTPLSSDSDGGGREAWLVQKLNERRDGEVSVKGNKVNPEALDSPAVAEPAAPDFTLKPGQELWIIERPQQHNQWASRSEDNSPGSGTLMTQWHYENEPAAPPRTVPVPLAHTDVHASIAGPISSVSVTQHFHNPFSGKIEAVYVFPLPDDAAVNDFVMTIGARSIRGVIREREEAKQIYDAAKARGHNASLMSQERSNIFTQRVANIEPNQTIDINITYFHTLGFRDGSYEFVFPMVVGPRFNPASTMNGIGAAPAYTSNTTGQPTEVQYLRPSERCGRDISIDVDLAAGMPIESLSSPSHQVTVNADPSDHTRAHVTLSSTDSIPNRDFLLRYRLSGGQIKGGIVTARTGNEGYFCFTLVPPDDLRYTQRGPVEMVFVIDCSGSMEGEPLRLAKRAVTNALQQLRPTDTFQVIRFSDTSTNMTDRPVAADQWNIRRGVDYVNALASGGGTMMLKGLEPALEYRSDWSRTRFVCLLSDGLLGNEPEVLKQLSRKLGDSRIFSVGIGSAPNRALLNAMARIGRGAAAYIADDRDADQSMSLFIDRVSSAAMTDLRIDWGDLDVTDVYPKRTPDLFVGRPVVMFGKFKNRTSRATHAVKVSGRVGDKRETLSFSLQAAGGSVSGIGLPADVTSDRANPGQLSASAPALSLVWARNRIQDLDEYAGWGSGQQIGAGSPDGPNKRQIRELALQYGLVSAYTSFIAVDSSERTQGSYGTTVQVPENMPRGVRYDTTVGGSGGRVEDR